MLEPPLHLGSFQQLYTALDAACLREQEEVELQQKTRKKSAKYEISKGDSTPGLYFQGQDICGIPRKPGFWSSASTFYLQRRDRQPALHNQDDFIPGKNGADSFGIVSRCNNCGSKKHFVQDCRVKINLVNSVSKTIKRNPNRIKHISFEICQQAEGAIFLKY